MKYKKILLIVISIIIVIISTVLITNKTFFKTTYIGNNDVDIYVPRFSYFNRESGAFVASFYSFKSKSSLEKDINNYLKEFEKEEKGYKKDKLFIESYIVENKGLYRKIYITYDN